MPGRPLQVCYRGQTGLVVLSLSLAAFDPNRPSAAEVQSVKRVGKDSRNALVNQA